MGLLLQTVAAAPFFLGTSPPASAGRLYIALRSISISALRLRHYSLRYLYCPGGHLPLRVFSSVSCLNGPWVLLWRLPRPMVSSVVVHSKLSFLPVSVVVNSQFLSPCTLVQIPPASSQDFWLCWLAIAEPLPTASTMAVAAA